MAQQSVTKRNFSIIPRARPRKFVFRGPIGARTYVKGER